jgi:N-acetylneuraminate synthase
MTNQVKVKAGDRYIGDGESVYVIAEIGINHNGSVEIAKLLIDGAKAAGCDAVKFQKRTPELCVPKDQWYIERDTPWGRMTYIDYRRKVEFSFADYEEIDAHCEKLGIHWFASCWDEDSLTDLNLLKKKKATGRPLMISTGMSTLDEIKAAVDAVGTDNLLIAHSTSTYPCKLEELNLNMILTLRKLFPDVPIGYSGHETGLAPTWAAVAIGACFVERHITLDRAMWGTDQAASVEVKGFSRLVDNIRDIEKSLGDGVKKVYESEMGSRKKLRRVIA